MDGDRCKKCAIGSSTTDGKRGNTLVLLAGFPTRPPDHPRPPAPLPPPSTQLTRKGSPRPVPSHPPPPLTPTPNHPLATVCRLPPAARPSLAQLYKGVCPPKVSSVHSVQAWLHLAPIYLATTRPPTPQPPPPLQPPVTQPLPNLPSTVPNDSPRRAPRPQLRDCPRASPSAQHATQSH